MNFETSIVEYSAKQLVGMKVLTNMQNAMKDCPTIWGAFMPRMFEVSREIKETFGVSVMINENDFEYWAAVEATPQTPLPEGLQTVDIYSGTYVRCTVPGLAKLGDAYMYLYTTYIQGNTEYALNAKAHCFELYPCNYSPDMPFEIYMPVTKV